MQQAMQNTLRLIATLACCLTLFIGISIALGQDAVVPSTPEDEAGLVRTANLIYAGDKSSVCFADAFLTQISRETNIKTTRRFDTIRLDSDDLFDYPFAVMTGEGVFTLTQAQRENLRDYLVNGGFVIASAGCSSKDWHASIEKEIAALFPDNPLFTLDAKHPIFHTVYDITSSKYRTGEDKLPLLKGLELDGRTVLVLSPDGLNDSTNAGPDCCCCGGNEIRSAKLLNVNILAYALTH